MRARLGAGLLLVSTTLVAVAATPADAASGCDAPDTTWVGPATEGGSASWGEPSNWSGGVPTADSVVCIPPTTSGPHVGTGTALAATLTLQGTLTVGTSLEVGALEADGGAIAGGSTTVNSRLTGSGLTVTDGAALDQWGTAVFGAWDAQGARITVHGDAVLASGARIDSLAGLFTIADTGSLTMDADGAGADVMGGFANHGTVTVTAGSVFMMGAGGSTSGNPGEFSDGTFTAEPGAELRVAHTELRTGARLDHLLGADHITVPAGNTAVVTDSDLSWDPGGSTPNLSGAGELRLTDNSMVGGRIGGALTVTVPAGEVARFGAGVVQDRARIRADGELAQSGHIDLEDDAVLDIYGTHRAVEGGGFVDSWGADPGVEIIHPGGRLLCDEGSILGVYTPIVNHGTVDSGNGVVVFAPLVARPEASTGTFHAGPGDLYLGDAGASTPELVLDHATIEGPVKVAGPVRGNDLLVRGQLETHRLSDTEPDGDLVLAGTTRLEDGASISGDVSVRGNLAAEPGETGTATIDGAEVEGTVRVTSGTLSVTDLSQSTLAEGTLTGGRWSVGPGATLDLPEVTTNDATLVLEAPDASFGDGLAALGGLGVNGRLKLLGGADLAVAGRFVNRGVLRLSPGSRLGVGGGFQQVPTGALRIGADAGGIGRVRAGSLRDLAGNLRVQRGPAYSPGVGTVRTFLTSDGSRGADDAFDRVISPPYRNRKLRVDYDVNRVRLWVDRVG